MIEKWWREKGLMKLRKNRKKNGGRWTKKKNARKVEHKMVEDKDKKRNKMNTENMKEIKEEQEWNKKEVENKAV